MCTETFLRLPEEKRRRFLAAAWEEFTRVKFVDASINQIIRRAGIPRGSFYQYFTDKEDLFSYLMANVQENVVSLFQTLFLQLDGDIFRVQLALYDHTLDRNTEELPMLDRCVQLLRINPGLDLQKLMVNMLEQDMPPELREKIDTACLRRQEPAFVRRVFLMALGATGRAVMGALLRPDQAAEYRRELEAELEIIQYGSLRKREAPERAYQGGSYETKNDCPAAGAGADGVPVCGVCSGG